MNFKTFHPSLLSSVVAVLGATAVISTVTPARASITIGSAAPVTFGYGCVTNYFQGDCTTGENQFRTKVSQVLDSSNNPTQVLFQFFNHGSNPASITQVFFEDTGLKSLAGFAGVINSTGVNFSQFTPTRKLPGGSSISFKANYGAGANNPSPANGVDNPGEVLGILFNVVPGFADPFNAVITDLQKGGLRVGVQAQAFNGGGTESFVNAAVPEPFTMMGSGAAVIMGTLLKRKTAKRDQEKAEVS